MTEIWVAVIGGCAVIIAPVVTAIMTNLLREKRRREAEASATVRDFKATVAAKNAEIKYLKLMLERADAQVSRLESRSREGR